LPTKYRTLGNRSSNSLQTHLPRYLHRFLVLEESELSSLSHRFWPRKHRTDDKES
jgi:hypothetical protein